MGKHRKPKQKPTVKAMTAAVLGAGAVLPFALSGTAHAATASQWNCIAQFESRQRWHLQSGDPEGPPGTGASRWGGGLQFQPTSWAWALDVLHGRGISTANFGSHASNSTKQQQILAAEALLSVQGPYAAWATNGFSNCATLSPSMFRGGPNPWAARGYSGSNVPASVINGTSGDNFTGGATAPPPTPPPTGRWWHHWTVAKGDTLYRVASHAYGDGKQYPKVANANGISAPYVIHPGQVLYVP